MKEPLHPPSQTKSNIKSKLNVLNNKLHQIFASIKNAKSTSLFYVMMMTVNVIKNIQIANHLAKLTTS